MDRLLLPSMVSISLASYLVLSMLLQEGRTKDYFSGLCGGSLLSEFCVSAWPAVPRGDESHEPVSR